MGCVVQSQIRTSGLTRGAREMSDRLVAFFELLIEWQNRAQSLAKPKPAQRCARVSQQLPLRVRIQARGACRRPLSREPRSRGWEHTFRLRSVRLSMAMYASAVRAAPASDSIACGTESALG